MSVWQPAALVGVEGELVSVTVSVDPRDLEEVLEVLAELNFPVNPQICHGPSTTVEFPAYAVHLADIGARLGAAGFHAVSVKRMWEEIHAPSPS